VAPTPKPDIDGTPSNCCLSVPLAFHQFPLWPCAGSLVQGATGETPLILATRSKNSKRIEMVGALLRAPGVDLEAAFVCDLSQPDSPPPPTYTPRTSAPTLLLLAGGGIPSVLPHFFVGAQEGSQQHRVSVGTCTLRLLPCSSFARIDSAITVSWFFGAGWWPGQSVPEGMPCAALFC
jgi:hypothetical protein